MFGADGLALYFSKEVIPFISGRVAPEPVPVFHHVGVYAYRPDALRRRASSASVTDVPRPLVTPSITESR